MLRSIQVSRLSKARVCFLHCRLYTSEAVPAPNENFFRHTTYRFLHKEKEELAKRYLSFNVDGLKEVAGKACGSPVVLIRKLSECDYNKDFLLNLENGKEVVARLPLARAGPSRLVVASEVATTDFARRHLYLPVPNIVGWEANGGNNPVERDYILMERMRGVALEDVWSRLTDKMKRETITQIVKLEKKMISTDIQGGYGAIYYREDAEDASLLTRPILVNGHKQNKFLLGPTMQPAFRKDGRDELLVDPGPWDSALQYLQSIIFREASWISSRAVENPSPTPFDPPAEKRKVYLELLDKLSQVVPYLVPSTPSLLKPTLTPHAFSASNILICDKALSNGTIKLTAITNWQHALIQPLYLAARPIPQLEEPVRAHDSQPDNFRVGIMSDKQQDKPLTEQTKWSEFHKSISHAMNKPWHDAYYHPLRAIRMDPITYAADLFPNHISSLRESLFEVIDNWDALTSESGAPCPISFADEDAASRLLSRVLTGYVGKSRKSVDDFIGFGCKDGKVKAEYFEDAFSRNAYCMGLYSRQMEMELQDDEDKKVLELVPSFWIYRPWEDDEKMEKLFRATWASMEATLRTAKDPESRKNLEGEIVRGFEAVLK